MSFPIFIKPAAWVMLLVFGVGLSGCSDRDEGVAVDDVRDAANSEQADKIAHLEASWMEVSDELVEQIHRNEKLDTRLGKMDEGVNALAEMVRSRQVMLEGKMAARREEIILREAAAAEEWKKLTHAQQMRKEGKHVAMSCDFSVIEMWGPEQRRRVNSELKLLKYELRRWQDLEAKLAVMTESAEDLATEAGK